MSPTPLFELAQRYDVLEEIGRGGHAVVYRAHDRLLVRDVAIKLPLHGAHAGRTLARFQQQVRIATRLQHAHVLQVYELRHHEEQSFLVMELASAGSLASRLALEAQLPIDEALQIAREISLALAYAHTNGILHRDIKPTNILLGRGGALLSDFDAPSVTDSMSDHPSRSGGPLVDTPHYRSPEQLRHETEIDARSDQYSLACVLFEMLYGVHPHSAEGGELLPPRRLSGWPERVPEHRSAVPAPVVIAMGRALSPLPADRFSSIEGFYSAITFMDPPHAEIPGSGQ